MRGNQKRLSRRRVAAALGALTLSLIGVAGVGAPAFADDAFGNIDSSKTGSIIIHKHVYQTSTSVTASPDGATSIPSDPVAGVTFTAYKVSGIDLTTAAGWTAVAALTPTCPPTGATAAGNATTNGSGQATISSLPVGAYVVCETNAPSTVVDKAQPFVVTIPFPYKRTGGGTTESWLYDVNVYPKNGVAGITKTVLPQGTNLGLGSTASYPVTTDIPAIASNANFTHYYVQDPMDGTRLTSTGVASATVGGTAVPSSYYTVSHDGNLVTLQFTSAGLTWLKGQGGKKLVTTFTGTVSALGAGSDSGVINNTASFSAATAVGSVPSTPDTPVDPSNPNYPGTHSAPAVTENWGDLKLSKVDAGSTTTGLAGATFQVYAAADPYAATCSATATTGSPISVGGVTDFTTGTGGALTISGLFVSDSKNDTVNASQRCYVLVETAAPAGYILPTGDAAKTPVAVKTGITAGLDATIQNTRVSGVTLPMTGSDGIVVFSIAGLSLVALGLVVAAIARRRTHTA